MPSALDTYLGWEQPQHRRECARPAWDVAVRTDEGEPYSRPHHFGDPPLTHSCPDEDCRHGNWFGRITVRIVCHSCGAAHVVSGERTDESRDRTVTTRETAYGLPPRRAAGLLLWPARPWLDRCLRDEAEPHDFVVTRSKVREVTEDTVVGQLTLGRGKLGGLVWAALAVPDPKGEFGFGQPIRWAQCNDGRGRGGSPLRSVGAAARWVAARLAEQQSVGGAA